MRALSQKEQDIQMMLAADVHLGTKNCDFQMERYVFKRRTDGMCLHSRIRAFLSPHANPCRRRQQKNLWCSSATVPGVNIQRSWAVNFCRRICSVP